MQVNAFQIYIDLTVEEQRNTAGHKQITMHCTITNHEPNHGRGVQWINGRVLDSRPSTCKVKLLHVIDAKEQNTNICFYVFFFWPNLCPRYILLLLMHFYFWHRNGLLMHQRIIKREAIFTALLY